MQILENKKFLLGLTVVLAMGVLMLGTAFATQTFYTETFGRVGGGVYDDTLVEDFDGYYYSGANTVTFTLTVKNTAVYKIVVYQGGSPFESVQTTGTGTSQSVDVIGPTIDSFFFKVVVP